jgi:Na+/proline symporter
MTALGLVIWVLGGDYFTLNQSILIGAAIVTVYTIFGGMWSVALTDLIQTAAIVIGLIIVAALLSTKAGGAATVIEHARAAGKFQFFPTGDAREWWSFIAAFLTFALGSIPQQDVFQRVTSAKDERTAVTGTLLGGGFYFIFAFIPMYIAYAAIVIDPGKVELFNSEDSRVIQQILPNLILQETPTWTQVLFFGALLSAILSTASGTLLAPASLFTENVLQQFLRHFGDRQLLWTLRGVLVLFSIAATTMAVNSTSTMYEMVQNAYKVTLVAAFVPLAAGVYWRRASTQGAIFSIVCGLTVWLLLERTLPEGSEHPWAIIPPQLPGLVASFLGMVVGSLLPQWIQHSIPDDAVIANKTRINTGH